MHRTWSRFQQGEFLTKINIERSNPNHKIVSKNSENDIEERVRRIVFLIYQDTEMEKLANDLNKIEAAINRVIVRFHFICVISLMMEK